MRTHKDKVTHSVLHGTRQWKQRILKPKEKAKDGYYRVTLWKNKKQKDFLVHRLVAFAFIKQPLGKNIINHKDGNKRNNDVNNLEWCDSSHNSNHAFDTGLINTGKKTLLIDKRTGEEHEFRSMAKASHFIGRSHGFISDKLKQGYSDIDGYLVEIDEPRRTPTKYSEG